ncbi:Non-ribosomal peptide synthase [Actinosynnema pretiosum subsp. pretiosum]|nr:Non-ribosomal peptide synthase [Actinosynnema pretiosum subsp. pretiosum]
MSGTGLRMMRCGRSTRRAVNGVDQCAVTGPVDEVEELRARLGGLGVDARVLRISAAAHSSLVDPVVDEYTARVRRVRLAAPEITWISDRTGRPVSVSEATDPVFLGAAPAGCGSFCRCARHAAHGRRCPA